MLSHQAILLRGIALSGSVSHRTFSWDREQKPSVASSVVQGGRDEVGHVRFLAGLVDEAEGVHAEAIHVTVVLWDAHIIQQKGELHQAT